jgi:DNA-binding MarR family transcriptional regulator
MNDDWDVVGYVISSRYRVAVLGRLATSPATPSRIAADEGLSVSHISRALSGLSEHDLVELLVPEDRRKGRVYGITTEGREAWDLIQSKDLIE